MMLDHRFRFAYTRSMPRGGPVIFKGTSEEALALSLATQRYCAIDKDRPISPLTGVGDACTASHRCSTHSMLLDQATVDRLLFARRIAHELWTEECCMPRLPHYGRDLAA